MDSPSTKALYGLRICLALKARSHASSPRRDSGPDPEQALKARLKASVRHQISRMNRAFSAGGFALTPPWGAAPGCYERCAFGAKHVPGFHPVSGRQGRCDEKTRGRGPGGPRPHSTSKKLCLRNGDLPGLDVLGLRQSQRQDALLDLGPDPISINGRVELKRAPEIIAARFVMDQRPVNCGQ